jgi:membrane protein implicated in regulation of membrane protease activity
VSIWFAAGALAALICAALKGPLWLQAIWFVVVSGVTLILTRPLVKKYVNGKSVATNADRNIGRSAVVTEKVDNLAGVGTVKLDGVLWSARSVNDAPIEEGTTVVVREIRGVKLLVEPESGE